MRKGTTSDGFAFTFDEAVADDMRIIDLIAEISNEETPDFEKLAGASKLTTLLIGKEQKAALYSHIGAQHEGRVPFAAVEQALLEIMRSGGDAVKN